MFDLSGKVVLATGANGDIGLAFLQVCARQGANVVVWGRREDRNAQAVEALKTLGSPRGHADTVDVTNEAAVDTAFGATISAMGRADCVFANAGYQHRAPSFADIRLHTLRTAIQMAGPHGLDQRQEIRALDMVEGRKSSKPMFNTCEFRR